MVRGKTYVAAGVVANYYGVTEIIPTSATGVVDLGVINSAPTAVTLTLAELASKQKAYEGSLVRVAGLSKVSGTWAYGTNNPGVIVSNSGNTATVVIKQGSTATLEPTYPAAVAGIYGQNVAASPYVGGAQILPRDVADVESAPGIKLTMAQSYVYESTNPVTGGVTTATLTVSRQGTPTSQDLVVALSVDPTNLLMVPASATIPAGQSSVDVTVEAIDNSTYLVAGYAEATITGSVLASELSPGTIKVTILEDETAPVADTIKPVITLIGANPQLIANGAVYADPGASVTDNVDATRTVTGTGTVNTAIAGDYTVTYNATDVAGNVADAVIRTVRVAAPLGTTYSSWLGAVAPSDAAFWDYVFGAATPGTLNPSLRPSVAITGGNLVLTYFVRQGTTGLTVTAKTSVDLAAGPSGWGIAGITDVAVGGPTTVNGVSVQQRTASVAASGAKSFLKLEAVQQ